MFIRKLVLVNLIVLLLSCSKSKNKFFYNGEVIRQPNYCTSGTGFPFVIKYADKNNNLDSIITTTLPTQYKFSGQKIKFQMRELNSTDERIACTSLFAISKQVIVFDVKQQ